MPDDDAALPALKHFFAAYFHQDWVDDAPSSEDVVRDFLTFEAPRTDELRMLAAGVARLGESYSESELVDVMYEKLGSHYRPVPPQTYASWLAEIEQTFRQAADT